MFFGRRNTYVCPRSVNNTCIRSGTILFVCYSTFYNIKHICLYISMCLDGEIHTFVIDPSLFNIPMFFNMYTPRR